MSDSKLIILETIDFIPRRQLVPLAQVMHTGARPRHVPSYLSSGDLVSILGGPESSGLHREVWKELKAWRSQQEHCWSLPALPSLLECSRCGTFQLSALSGAE